MTRAASSCDEQEPEAEDGGIGALYRTEQSVLARFFRRNRATPDEANDLVQETFLRLARSDGAIARPRAYLRQIALNLLRDRAKMAGRRSAHLHEPFEDDTISDMSELRRLEARDSLARVEAVIRRMKPRTREIFLAHRLDGLTYAEIADRTGLSVKGVEKQMSRAIALLMRHADMP